MAKSRGGRKLSSKQLRYLFAIGFLGKSGGGKSSRVVVTGDLRKVQGPALALAKAFAKNKSDSAVKTLRSAEESVGDVLAAIKTARATHEKNEIAKKELRVRLQKRLERVDNKYWDQESKIDDARDAAKAAGDTASVDALRAQGKALAKRKARLESMLEERLKAVGKAQNYRPHDTLNALTKQAGFDGKPAVKSKAEIDALVAAGHTQIFRGVGDAGGKSASQVQEQFRTGEFHMGSGVFGNGSYFSQNKDTAEEYSDGSSGSILRSALDPNARGIKHSELITQYRALADKHPDLLSADESSLAIAMGYDYVLADKTASGKDFETPHHVILNRGKLAVEEAK